MVNNIKNNIISEISTKKGLNTLNELKNEGIIKYKKRTSRPQELNLFSDLLDTILNDKTLESESQEDNTLMSSKDENENENENKNENKNENENENDKTLMSSKDENEKQNKLLNNDNNANAKNKKPIPIPKKQQRKKKMRIKTFC